jgi:hypothetical protein
MIPEMREIQPYPPCSVPLKFTLKGTLAKRDDNVTHALTEPTIIPTPLTMSTDDHPAPAEVGRFMRGTRTCNHEVAAVLCLTVPGSHTAALGANGNSSHPAPFQRRLAVQP